jgi:two-component system cell cycle sensor histidine kinase/response regulator CckA
LVCFFWRITINNNLSARIFEFFPALCDPPEAARGRFGEISDLQGHGEMILVVDDETALLRVTELILRKYGYDVLPAGDGVDAVAIYARQAQQIALVLTDVQMPRMDGIALSGALHHLNPQVPIIAATGHNKEFYENKLKAVGVEVLLSKPYKIWKLLKAIQGVLPEPP